MQPIEIGKGATVKGLVTEAAKLLSDLAANDLAALDVNVGEADVLTILGVATQDVVPSDLSDWLSITGAGTTGRLNALERRGLIERRKNPIDGRSVTIHLTRDGRRLATKVLEAKESAVMTALMDDLGARATDELISSLESLVGSARGLLGERE